MYRNLTTIILALALLIGTAWARDTGLVYHEVQVVDEVGMKVTIINSVEIYNPGTTTDANIYSDRNLQNAITIPMTESSTNTTLVDGFFSWYGNDGYSFSITDGNNISTNATHRIRTASEGTLVFPTYLTSITTSQYLDAESVQFGTSPDWTVNAGTTANVITWTPTTDNAEFRIGVSGTGANATMNVYVGDAIGLKIDSSVPSFIWDGGAASINASSNFATNINTGTSTGAINIGSETSGAWAINGTTTGTINADDSIGMTVTAGTGAASIDIDSTLGGVTISANAAGKDINIDSVLGSIYIVAEENDACAVWIEADGSTASAVRIHNDTGTAASATTESDASIQLLSDVGGIGLFSALNGANAIRIEADGGASETVAISSVKGTGVASIDIDSTVGGITISANAAGKDINIDSVLGSINIEAEEDDANAVMIVSDGSTASGILVHNDTGTSVTESHASIQLLSDAGGIAIQSDGDLDDAIVIIADGGTTAEITVHNDQGTAVDSIELISDDGGITITAGKPVVITNAFEPDIVLIPDAATYTVLANNSGQDHIWPDLTADCNVTMVAEADGLHYRFIYVGGAMDAHDWIFNTQDDANYFIGGLVTHDVDDGGDDTTTVYSDGNSNSVLTVLTPGAGTVVEMWCDGTNWRVTGTVIGTTDAAVTFADQ